MDGGIKISLNDENKENSNNPSNMEILDNISTNAYGCSLDNIFITFKSKSDILYLVYSTLKKSIIAYNLNTMENITEIKNAHKDYIDNFRQIYDIINKKDIILSLSSGDNNIKIWDIKNWDCLYNINNLYRVGILLSACFLVNENVNYIVTCNCFLYNIIVIDFKGNTIKKIKDSSNYTLFIDIYFEKQKNQYYIITGNRTSVKSYNYDSSDLYFTYSDEISTHHRSIIIYNDNNIVKLIFSCEEGYIKIFNFHSGILLNKINLNKESLLGICLFDSNYLLIGTKNKRVILIDLKEGKIKKIFSWT